MEYAVAVLKKLSKFEGGDQRIPPRISARRRPRSKLFVSSVPCGYCRGTGEDPKYGNGSKCPVCSASGTVRVTPPVVTCLKCSGTGRENGNLSCLACRGVGVVSVRKEAGTCPNCKGTGKVGVFYCTFCKGQGIA